jgi:hypothetical protein
MRHPTLAVLTGTAALVALSIGSLVVGPASSAPASPTAPSTVHVRLRAAIRALPVADHSHVAGYDRDKDFGEWITQHGECDTRAVVLIQESLRPVTKSYYCTVSKGRWYSYYNARYYDNAYDGAIQIDHTVPVQNAWVSGAWQWTKPTRVRYYNDLKDPRTLVGVDAHDNEVKSNQDPTTWLPRHGRCRYVRYWVAVKTRWHLNATAAEKTKLATLAADCSNPRLTISLARVRYR